MKSAPTAVEYADTSAELLGMARLVRLAYEGRDLTPIWQRFVARLAANPQDAAAQARFRNGPSLGGYLLLSKHGARVLISVGTRTIAEARGCKAAARKSRRVHPICYGLGEVLQNR